MSLPLFRLPNARHRLPNEAMEVYAADVCRLVKEAFPDFEKNASEFMKMSRFIAGLDQELQIKCHKRGVKTFQEAFEVAARAERARQAARLISPVLPGAVAQDVNASSVNTVSSEQTYLKTAIQDLTSTVKDLSKEQGTLKLKLDNRDSHSPTRQFRQPSPEYGHRSGRSPNENLYSGGYRSGSPSFRASNGKYSRSSGFYNEDNRGRRQSPGRQRSQSPQRKHVSFQDQKFMAPPPMYHRQPADYHSYSNHPGYSTDGSYYQGNQHELLRRGAHQLTQVKPKMTVELLELKMVCHCHLVVPHLPR